jgi:hypothetical protein
MRRVVVQGESGRRLTNGVVDLVVSGARGMRITRYGLAGGPNMLASAPGPSVPTTFGPWKPLGGHRLWVAPESMPGSYAPDAEPVRIDLAGERGADVCQPADAAGIEKRLRIELAATGTVVRVTHTIVNRTCWPIRVAPWAISIVRTDGTAIIPQPVFRSHKDDFLPARPMAQWAFTDVTDPRWSIGAALIRLTPDAAREAPQKIGVGNTAGWCALQTPDGIYIKRSSWIEGATYPDFGCNNELFTEGDYLEMETLGPLSLLTPGGAADHVEWWGLYPREPDMAEADLHDRLRARAATTMF